MLNSLKDPDHALLFTICLYLLLVSKYTREAGVRMLERRIGAVCRAVAVKVAENSSKNKQQSEGKEEGVKVGLRDHT